MCKLDPPGMYTALIKSKSKCGLSENSRSVHECCNETVILLAVKGPNQLVIITKTIVFCILCIKFNQNHVHSSLCCIFVHVSELSLLVINSQSLGDIINSFNQPQFGRIKV